MIKIKSNLTGNVYEIVNSNNLTTRIKEPNTGTVFYILNDEIKNSFTTEK